MNISLWIAAMAFGVFLDRTFIFKVKFNDLDIFPLVVLAVAVIASIIGVMS